MSALKNGLATIASTIPKHIRDASICSTLTDDLRKQYGRRSIRVIKGDAVRIMRGEYAGIEGKVEKVDTSRGTLSIEGVQREKIRGGNVKVQIHASNVRVSGLNLDDKYRQNNIFGRNTERDRTKDEAKASDNDKDKNNINSSKQKKKNKNKNNNVYNEKTSTSSASKNKIVPKKTVSGKVLDKEEDENKYKKDTTITTTTSTTTNININNKKKKNQNKEFMGEK